MKYFHIQRISGIRTEWSKGDIVKTGDNDFFKDILKGIERISKPNLKGYRVIQDSREVLDKRSIESISQMSNDYEKSFYLTLGLCYENETLASTLLESHLQYLKWIREEIFENSRQKINPNLPSRKNCIWLCDKKGLENWWNTFSTTENKKILEIELDKDGEFHFADAEFLNLDTYSITEFENASEKYWKGIKNSDLDIEILYQGKFKVMNEYRDISQVVY